jgi:hypothetical protein
MRESYQARPAQRTTLSPKTLPFSYASFREWEANFHDPIYIKGL